MQQQIHLYTDHNTYIADNRYHHADVIKWEHFPRYWPFVREFTGHRWISLTKASGAEL